MDTVPRFFNWGAFLIPVPWCLAHRQWLWAIAAAATPVVLVARAVGPHGFASVPFREHLAFGLAYIVFIVICPLWLSLVFGVGLMVTLNGYLDIETIATFVYWIIPLAVSLYLGIVGNKLAVRERRFEDDWDFRLVQRLWTAWGVVVFPITPALLYLVAYLMGVFALVDVIR